MQRPPIEVIRQIDAIVDELSAVFYGTLGKVDVEYSTNLNKAIQKLIDINFEKIDDELKK